MELNAQEWGIVLFGLAVLSVGWAIFAGGRRKPAASPASRTSEATPGSSPARAAEVPPVAVAVKLPNASLAATQKVPRPASKAVVWEVPQGLQIDDEDITVIRAIPVFDLDPDAEISVDAPPATAERDGESDEERISRIELSYQDGAETEEITAASARILLYAGGDSDVGRVRARNEDSLLMMSERSLFAIADGMGGHRGGEMASTLAIDTLEDAFSRSAFEGRVQADGNVPRRARELAAAVQMSHECVRAMAAADRDLSNMGTTLVAARFSPNKQRLYVGHVGDSRCYRLRRGNFRLLTTDHTMASLGMKGPRSKDLYQAVGVNPGLAIDLIVDKPQDDDVYLLCSDGLSKMLTDDEIRDVLIEQEDLEGALHTLIQGANERGGNDNVTVIIVKVLSRNSKKALETILKSEAKVS